MSTQVATQTQSRGAGQRGRRGYRGRGGGRGRGGRTSAPLSEVKDAAPETAEKKEDDEKAEDKIAEVTAEEDDSTLCWICAEPVKYWSVSECNHRTCHVCALRLRALYKKLDCTFCKEPQQSVIFTTSPDAPWSSYTPEDIPYKDAKLSIYFETQEMMEDSLILLRFNCPDSTCDFIANGWSDLKLHTRGTHGKVLCDLCIRFKKIFAHEHVLYSPNQLPFHLPSLQRGHRSAPKEPVEGGVHPLCEFCRECFFSEDEIYSHMRERHEECFICKRNEVKDQYFRNYEALEQHFNQAHFPCMQPACLVRKFVVFGSTIDLKAHMVEEHGADMSAKDRKDARRLQADFEFEEVGVGGRRGRHDRGDREREREPPPTGPPRSNAAGARRREAFGGNLTTNGGAPPTPNAGPSRTQSRRQSPSPAEDVDPAVAERQAAVLARVSAIAPNPNNAVSAVRAALRSYRSNESAARDFISTIWNISDRNLEGTASIINGVVDLLDDEEKKKDLLQAWNGFKIEQRNQFPELVPSATGSEWAGITGGRLLNAKQSTASRSSSQSSRQVFDRVARAAASGPAIAASMRSAQPASTADKFPPLQASTGPGPNTSGFRQGQHKTAWSASAAGAGPSAPVVRGPTSVPGPGARTKGAPHNLSRAAFPELPTSTASRVPKNAVKGNQSLRNILGESLPAAPAWGTSGKNSAEASGTATPIATPDVEASPEAAAGPGGGKKKGKGKQKQTLFTLGSFPT